jgi:hypothetical protein
VASRIVAVVAAIVVVAFEVVVVRVQLLFYFLSIAFKD